MRREGQKDSALIHSSEVWLCKARDDSGLLVTSVSSRHPPGVGPRQQGICSRARSVPRRWGALSRGNGRTPGAGRGRAGKRPLRPPRRHPSLRQTFLGLRARRSCSSKGGAPRPPARRALRCFSRPAAARHLVAPSRTARGHAAAAGDPAPGLGGAGERER